MKLPTTIIFGKVETVEAIRYYLKNHHNIDISVESVKVDYIGYTVNTDVDSIKVGKITVSSKPGIEV
jgi:hypothetical protein